MLFYYPVLRQRMGENGTTWGELAAVANISKISFHLKMWGIKRWTLTDAVNICCFFHTQDAEHLFQKKRV